MNQCLQRTEQKILEAVKHYWDNQKQSRSDNRLKKFEEFIIEKLNTHVLLKKKAIVEGFYRKQKHWDILVPGKYAIEMKSINEKSFQKNINNRIEEAIGNAVDASRANPHMKFFYFIISEYDSPESFKNLAELYECVYFVYIQPDIYKMSIYGNNVLGL